jgi:hypothetical protein
MGSLELFGGETPVAWFFEGCGSICVAAKCAAGSVGRATRQFEGAPATRVVAPLQT